MAGPYTNPIKNDAAGWIGYITLEPETANGGYQANPTLATGDVKVSIDGGALANLGTLPSVAPASSMWVKVTLSQAEINGDNICVQFIDAAGDEWRELAFTLQPDSTNVAAVKAETALIVADTNELQTDWADGGRLDVILDAASAPTAAAVADAVWDELQSAHVTVGSFGEVATEVASILADTNELQADDTPGALAAMDTKLDTIDNFLDTEIAAITAAVITNAAGVDIAADIIAVKAETALIVADTGELQTDWVDGGRLDLLLDTAATAGDPWSTALPGAYGAGTAGKLIGDNIDAPLSTIDTVVDGIQTDLSNGTDGLGAIKADTALILTDTGTTLQAELDAIQAAVITNAAGVDIAADIIAIKAETALIVADTNELQTDDIPGTIAALNDPTAAVIADAVWDEVQSGHVAVGSFGEVATEVAAILVDTGTTIPGTITTAQNDLDIITGASGVNLLTATQNSIDAIETDTGTTLQAELDAIQAAVITNAAGVDIAADIIALKAETSLILTDTGTTLQAELDAIQAAVITNAAGVDIAADIIALKAETVLIVADTNELQTDWVDGGRLDNLLDSASAAGDPWSTALPGAYGAGTAGKIVGDNIDAPLSTIDTVVDGIQTDLSNGTDGLGAIKAETALILTDTGTTLQAELDAIQAAVITNAAGVDIAADIIAMKAETALIVADTAELQGDWVNGGRLDLILDIIAADTTTDIPALIATAQADLDIITGATGVNLLAATQASIDAIELDTGTTLQAELDAIQAAVITNAAGVDIAADIIALKAETALILTDTGTTLQAELDAIQAAVITNATGVDIAADIIALKAETTLIVADTNELQTDDVPGLIAALNDAPAVSAATIADAVLDEAMAGHVAAGSLGKAVADIEVDAALILVDTGTTLQAELDAIQAAVITNATGADIAADIIAMKAETALIVADTNELQTDWADGGRLDLILDAATAPTAAAVADAVLDEALSGHVVAGSLGKAIADIETDATAILVDTATTIPGLLPTSLSATGGIKADAIAINADATSAANLAKTTAVIGRGTAAGGGSTTSIPTSAFSPAGAILDQFVGRIITFDADTGTVALRGQSTDITASSNVATPTFTVSSMTTAPASGDTFSVT
jgi:hypothetical protein